MNLIIPRYQPDLPVKIILSSIVSLFRGGNRRGAAVAELESLFASEYGVKNAIAVSSVRYGLRATIKYYRFPPGSEILCSPITIYPVVEMLIASGLKPVFVDICPDNFSLDINDARKKITPRTTCILATHLWGLPNSMGGIYELARQRGLALFEDASQCLNGTSGNVKAGTFGNAGFFSMGITKTVNAFGGAMMTTDDDALADFVREKAAQLNPPASMALLKSILAELALNIASRRVVFTFVTAPLISMAALVLKKEDRLVHSALPRSARSKKFPESLKCAFSDIQARAAIAMMKNLFLKDNKRKRIAEWYRGALSDLPGLRIPRAAKGDDGNYWMFATFSHDPSALKKFLIKRRVDSLIPSLDACHEMPFFEEFNAELPQASRVSREALCLPCYNSITRKDAERVVKAVWEYFEAQGE